MKHKNIKLGLFILASLSVASCSDFDEININPLAANATQVQPEYFINNAIIGAQQNPHVSERAFVLYWKAAGRFDRVNSLPAGVYNDGWTTDYYNAIAGWLTNINGAIQLVEEQENLGGATSLSKNLKEVARIWRVYLMSELSDNFGPIPIKIGTGSNPNFNSVEEVYSFMLEELKDASAKINTSVSVPESVTKTDPAYGYNFTKWQKYAHSMLMRLSMRISEANPSKAKEYFEYAANKQYISQLADNFQVQEKPGWDDLTGVMSREWNNQFLSATLNNLYIGLGGISSQIQQPDLTSAVKANDWLGVKYDDHFATKTNAPAAGFWFDGLPATIDPRAYKLFPIPGNWNDSEMNYYPSWSPEATRTTKRNLMKKDSPNDVLVELDAKFTWNASVLGSWGDKGSLNTIATWAGAIPRLANRFRNSSSKRLFFGAWESYFLIAEASLKGWNVPISGKNAYEKGIEMNFEYNGVASHFASYINSENYNRVGTSVKWEHTAEPTAVTMRYKNGYTNADETTLYTYPKNGLYKNGNVNNDQLTKIITQKFLAQVPWLPLEGWNDHRRLGLPFFENPAIEKPLTSLPSLTEANYMESKISFFPQRLKYPSFLASNVAQSYAEAVEKLGGEDSIFTPLWWAKKQ